MIASTPQPPYWAVLFTSQRRGEDPAYASMAEKMEALAKTQPGYLGIEHAGDANGSITISYWRSEAEVAAWKKNVEHAEAQRLGKSDWYARYQVRVCKVERAYAFER